MSINDGNQRKLDIYGRDSDEYNRIDLLLSRCLDENNSRPRYSSVTDEALVRFLTITKETEAQCIICVVRSIDCTSRLLESIAKVSTENHDKNENLRSESQIGNDPYSHRVTYQPIGYSFVDDNLPAAEFTDLARILNSQTAIKDMLTQWMQGVAAETQTSYILNIRFGVSGNNISYLEQSSYVGKLKKLVNSLMTSIKARVEEYAYAEDEFMEKFDYFRNHDAINAQIQKCTLTTIINHESRLLWRPGTFNPTQHVERFANPTTGTDVFSGNILARRGTSWLDSDVDGSVPVKTTPTVPEIREAELDEPGLFIDVKELGGGKYANESRQYRVSIRISDKKRLAEHALNSNQDSLGYIDIKIKFSAGTVFPSRKRISWQSGKGQQSADFSITPGRSGSFYFDVMCLIKNEVILSFKCKLIVPDSTTVERWQD